MTQRARKRIRRSRGSVRRKVLLALGVALAAIVVAIGGAAVWALNIWNSTPALGTLKPVEESSTSVVFAADGSRLGYIQSDTIRHPVESGKIPNLLKFATVAIEDEHFYEHGGVDPTAVVRAAWEDLKAGSAVQGGSTITQQLVRNLYIAHPQDNIERKIEEARLATEYEDRYTKDEILTKYLNTASYGTTEGRTAVGVQAATETYFDKGVSKLDLPEAAMIAGLPQAPSQYNPFLNPKAALQRRNEVLLAMLQQGYISQADYERASQQDLGLDRGHKYETIREPYFFDYVQQQLIDKYGVNTVRNGGLKVFTTINPGSRRPPARRSPPTGSDPNGPASGAAFRSTLRTATSSPWPRRSQLLHQPVQPGRRCPPPGRLIVQALRAGGRPQGGDGPRQHLLLGIEPEDAFAVRWHQLDGQQRRGRRRGHDERARRDRALGQRRLRPA